MPKIIDPFCTQPMDGIPFLSSIGVYQRLARAALSGFVNPGRFRPRTFDRTELGLTKPREGKLRRRLLFNAQFTSGQGVSPSISSTFVSNAPHNAVWLIGF